MDRKLDNTRALYLLNNIDIPDRTRLFLITHLVAFEDLVRSLNTELHEERGKILYLKDVIDKNNALNDHVIRMKENLISIYETIKDKKTKDQITEILIAIRRLLE